VRQRKVFERFCEFAAEFETDEEVDEKAASQRKSSKQCRL
jgi:hypothetical protein